MLASSVFITAYRFHIDNIAGNVLCLSLKRLINSQKVVNQPPCKSRAVVDIIYSASSLTSCSSIPVSCASSAACCAMEFVRELSWFHIVQCR